ncbi:MAG: dockerin type I repeat-containing protein [Ruminococcus sp.]|nr:dockerin type I repeat-containing protein [Ruminococcus sp.]
MKKLKKCLSAILAGMISVSLLGSLAVNAETTDTEKNIYTLSELFEMSEEEFFALDPVDENDPRPTSPKAMYNDLNLGMSYCNFFGNVFTCEYGKYVPYYTEKEIMRLLDVKDIDFVIESSITTDFYGNGISHLIWVHDRFYSKDFTKLEIAKIRYCLYQVMEFFHLSYVLDSGYSAGDVNEDGKLTAMDAAFIAKKLAEQKADELPETADVNGDGEITALDCAEIARFLAAKAMSKAEGMFAEQQ